MINIYIFYNIKIHKIIINFTWNQNQNVFIMCQI